MHQPSSGAAGPPPPRTRSVTENGSPILTVARKRHGSGCRELGGGPVVPIMVALSAGYHVGRRTRAGFVRKPPTVGAVTVADPAERTVFTVEGEADVLQLFVPRTLIEEAAAARVESVGALFNEHHPAIERGALGALAALRHEDSHSDLLLHSVGYQLAGILGRQRKGGLPRRGAITGPALRRVSGLVHARLDEPLPASPTLTELAQAAGVSKHHFIKAFRDTVGETPCAWVMRQRIERARTLLTHPNETVGDVAFRTGFSSPAHFVAVFRHRLGITPGMFRKAVLE